MMEQASRGVHGNQRGCLKQGMDMLGTTEEARGLLRPSV